MQSLPDSLAWAHPLVAEWFVRKFGTPTEPQEQGWPHILAGRATLISAPTGSGKTLAAFLACIDRLVRKALAGELSDRTEVLYVSPLKALGNDIQKNLEGSAGGDSGAGGRARVADAGNSHGGADRRHAAARAARHAEETSAYSGDDAGVALYSCLPRTRAARFCAMSRR